MHYPVGYNRSLMIVLLVAYIIRVGRCSPADALSEATDTAATAAESTTATTDPTTPDAAAEAAVTDQSSSANDDKASIFSKCKMELYKSLSTMGIGAGMVLKGFGQAALSVMGAIFGTFGGLISITATTGETVATGVNLVNNTAGRLVLVGDVTGGAATLANGLASTYRQNVDFTNENRDKLFDSLDKGLENYHPESGMFLIVPNPSAPPTNEGGQATDKTATESAPTTTPPV